MFPSLLRPCGPAVLPASPFPPLSLYLWVSVPSPVRLLSVASLQAEGDYRCPQPSPLHWDPALGGMGRGSTGCPGPASLGVGGGALSPPSPQPPSAQPQFSLSSLPLPLSPSCLHSPNTHRLLSWVLSHPTHTGCPSSLPPASHRPAPQSPLPPRLMGARWPPGDSATGLWEPRHPAFPCPHTQPMLPQ